MIVELVVATLCIAGTFVFLTACFTGIGFEVRRVFGLDGVSIDDGFLAFWVGFGMTILMLIVWNFFLPVALAAFVFFASLGSVVMIRNWRSLAACAGDRHSVPLSKPFRIFLALAVLWVVNQSMAGFRSYDGALYHLQGVQWAKAHPVVPGIANLHGPLAFNNSTFLYDAMIDTGLWEGGGFHIANGVLVFALLVQAIVAGARFASGGLKARAELYRFLCLAPVLYLVPLNGGVTSYSTDLPLTLILLVAAAKIYDLLDSDGATPATREDAYSVFAVAVLLATAVAIKVTAVVFAAVALPLMIWFWWKRRPARDRTSTRVLVATAVAVALFAAVWTARGIVMSGYPLFPLSIGGLPVDWRAPAEHADAEFAYLAFTEREFTWSIVSREWLRLAFWDDAYAIVIPAGLATIALSGYLLSLRWRRRSDDDRLRPTWWLLAPVGMALASWLISAPSTRYCAALFWTAAAVCICECHRAVWPALTLRGRRAALAAAVLLGVSPVVVEPLRAALQRGRSPAAALLAHNLILPPSDRWFHSIRTEAPVTPFVTVSGLVVNTPSRRPNPVTLPNACWNAPIPCTPNPAPNLVLRDPGNLRRGFRVDGDWQMLHWPYYWTSGFLSEWRQRRGVAISRR